MEEVEDQYNGDHFLRYNEEISNKTDHAQPWSKSESNGASGEAKVPVEAAKWAYVAALFIKKVRSTHTDLQNMKPWQVAGKGYMDPEFDKLFKFQLLTEDGPTHAKKVCKWTWAIIDNCEDLPVNPYGTWIKSVIDKHLEIAQELHAHLQSIGKFVKAMDLVDFMDTPKMQLHSGLKKWLDILTSQHWMWKLDYCWIYSEYVDGHKREDMVKYWKEVFLTRWANVKAQNWDWENGQPDPLPHEWRIVLWFHDELTFYANDQHFTCWIHKG